MTFTDRRAPGILVGPENLVGRLDRRKRAVERQPMERVTIIVTAWKERRIFAR
jgi:hypothetical protein